MKKYKQPTITIKPLILENKKEPILKRIKWSIYHFFWTVYIQIKILPARIKGFFTYGAFGLVNYYDWDWVYLVGIIQFKLKRMKKLFLEHGHLENSEEKAKEIQVVLNLFDIALEYQLYKDKFKKHEEKWGKSHFISEPLENGNYEFKTVSEKAKTPKQQEQERKEFIKIFEKENFVKQKSLRKAFKIINKKIQSWWD